MDGEPARQMGDQRLTAKGVQGLTLPGARPNAPNEAQKFLALPVIRAYPRLRLFAVKQIVFCVCRLIVLLACEPDQAFAYSDSRHPFALVPHPFRQVSHWYSLPFARMSPIRSARPVYPTGYSSLLFFLAHPACSPPAPRDTVTEFNSLTSSRVYSVLQSRSAGNVPFVTSEDDGLWP